ncbi:MAG: aryl-sulfate sulfotransferase, partial [bacterium]
MNKFMKPCAIFFLVFIVVVVLSLWIFSSFYPHRFSKIGKKTVRTTSSFNAIRSLPYVSVGTEGTHGSGQNVVINEAQNTYSGLNLYTSSHADEAYLIDMAGNVLHSWDLSRTKIWSKIAKKITTPIDGWRIAKVYPNLDLLAVYESLGLIKLDKNSQLLWVYSEAAHHDVWIDPSGDLYVLIQKIEKHPKLNENVPVINDYIAILDSAGEEKAIFSLLEIIHKSNYSFLLPVINNLDEKAPIDLLHTNSIQVFDGGLARKSGNLFKKGNILISVRNLSTIFIIDLESEQIVFAWGPT